jgi:hypothetical protein
MKIINDFESQRCEKDSGVKCFVQAALAAAGPLLASCASPSVAFNRSIL